MGWVQDEPAALPARLFGDKRRQKPLSTSAPLPAARRPAPLPRARHRDRPFANRRRGCATTWRAFTGGRSRSWPTRRMAGGSSRRRLDGILVDAPFTTQKPPPLAGTIRRHPIVACASSESRYRGTGCATEAPVCKAVALLRRADPGLCPVSLEPEEGEQANIGPSRRRTRHAPLAC